MKKIVLVNKQEYEVADHSTIENITVNFKSLTEVEKANKNFTEENMKRVVLGEEEYLFVRPLSLSVEVADDIITATWHNRKETEVELIKRQVAELQEAFLEG